jgi:hypothetical protein
LENDMAKPRTETERADRREAREAVREARRATKESRKLTTSLTGRNRLRMEVLTDVAQALTRAAERDVGERPRRARRMARKAAAQLEKASVRATASGDTARRALAESDAKKRAKTIKRRRAQAKQAQKMAKFVAFHTIAASIATPTDQERTEKDLKRMRRRADRSRRRGGAAAR